MAAAPDLNHDGFTDLLVGAPLEDEHRGAIYIYHGDGIHINHDYKQVHIAEEHVRCLPPLNGRLHSNWVVFLSPLSVFRGCPSLLHCGILAAA